MKYAYIFLDVAGTLLYKKGLYEAINNCLLSAGYAVQMEQLKQTHKALMSATNFPSRTTKSFYDVFNSKFLNNLGIHPTQRLLDDIFYKSKSLKWAVYRDVVSLAKLHIPIGIISNWDKTLDQKLKTLLPFPVASIFSSANVGISKPDVALYTMAFSSAHTPLSKILYVGDSLTLDIEPASALGVRSVLIDRENSEQVYNGDHIRSLNELSKMLEK